MKIDIKKAWHKDEINTILKNYIFILFINGKIFSSCTPVDFLAHAALETTDINITLSNANRV